MVSFPGSSHWIPVEICCGRRKHQNKFDVGSKDEYGQCRGIAFLFEIYLLYTEEAWAVVHCSCHQYMVT